MKREIVGYTNTKLVWNSVKRAWNLTNPQSETAIATTNNSSSYPFGTHNCYFEMANAVMRTLLGAA